MKLVDTNVLRAANGQKTHASLPCQFECVTRLQALMTETAGPVLLDSLNKILSEYLKNANHAGQPGVGDRFLQWVLINQGNPDRCPVITINQNAERGYEEYPTDAVLQHFDPSDRVFVAVALAVAATGAPMPTIWVATDTDWAHPAHYAAFIGRRIRIDFLCPDHVSAPQ